jgi:hypothetical protein
LHPLEVLARSNHCCSRVPLPGAPACGKAWTICKVLAKYTTMKHYM